MGARDETGRKAQFSVFCGFRSATAVNLLASPPAQRNVFYSEVKSEGGDQVSGLLSGLRSPSGKIYWGTDPGGPEGG